jgi:uncharacterized protein
LGGVFPKVSAETRISADMIREGYERFNRGELEWLFDQMHPEIVWEDSPRMPDSRSYSGIENVRRYLESFARHWDELRWEPEAVVEADDVVLAFVRLVAKGKASGATVDAEIAHVYNLREGLVAHVRTYFDRDEARREAGVPT